MNIDNKYVISTLNKSKIFSIKSIIFFIPSLILIVTFVFSLVLPTYNHYKFIKNGAHNYVYLLDDETLKDTGNEIKIIFLEKDKVMSHYDESLNQGGFNFFYKYNQLADIYICRKDIDLSNTMFSELNILDKVDEGNDTNIWLSFELAKSLHVDIGDTVYISVLDDQVISRKIPAKVSGICKTKYSDKKPVKQNDHVGNAIIFASDETFDWLLNETLLKNNNNKILFADEKINDLSDYEFTSKDSQINMVKEFVKKNTLVIAFILLLAVGILCIVLSFDMSFTLRRHNKNLVILNMLGAPIRMIRRVFIKMTLLNYFIAAFISLILVKFVFMQELLKIYVELEVLLVAFVILMMVATISVIIQSFSIKKL